MNERCPRPINTATDDSIEWCQENGHCGCVPISILRKKYGEALYPVQHTDDKVQAIVDFGNRIGLDLLSRVFEVTYDS